MTWLGGRDEGVTWTIEKPTKTGLYWYQTGEQSLLKLGLYAFSDKMKAI
jgi:hypothetical protein